MRARGPAAVPKGAGPFRPAAWAGSRATTANGRLREDGLEVDPGAVHPLTKEVNVAMTDGPGAEIETEGERGLGAGTKEDPGQGTGSAQGGPEAESATEAESEDDLGAEIGGAQGVEAGAGDPAPPVLAVRARKLRTGPGPKRKRKVGTVLKTRKRTRTTRTTRRRRMLGTLTRISWRKK